MKKNKIIIAGAILLSVSLMNSVYSVAFGAEVGNSKTTGKVTFEENTDPTGPVDPTDPTNPIDPTDPGTPSGGALSIDYVSSYDFGKQKISAKDETYTAKLVDITDASTRPNWVQVTDKRGTNAGWKLQVQQGAQLSTGADASAKELKGAEIKLTNAAAATGSNNQAKVPSNVPTEVTLDPTGASQDVMVANTDEGMGTWVDVFGDDTTGKDSITLTVPGTTEKVKDAAYSTELTWVLSDTVV